MSTIELQEVEALPVRVAHLVKRSILATRVFTISDLVRLTRCNPGSVRTTVQRLQAGGYVVAGARLRVSSSPSGFGAPAIQFRLTDNEKLLRRLSDEVASLEVAPVPLDEEILSSPDFVEACDFLDQALHSECTPEMRHHLIEEASTRLVIAESMAEEAEPLVRAKVAFERARIALTQGNAAEASIGFAVLLGDFSELSAPAPALACAKYLLAINSVQSQAAAINYLQKNIPNFQCTVEFNSEIASEANHEAFFDAAMRSEPSRPASNLSAPNWHQNAIGLQAMP